MLPNMGSSMKDMPQQAEFYKRLGENLRQARKRAKLSQDEVANLVGLKRTSLTNIESGRQHPPLHVLCDIAEKLQVAVSELLPAKQTRAEPQDLHKMVGDQLRGADELAFITTAIGLTQQEP